MINVCTSHLYLAECQSYVWLWRIVPIIYLVIGTVGNILNLFILSRNGMKRFLSTVYLVFLATSDMMTLWTVTFPNMLKNGFGIDIWVQADVICKLLKWLKHSSAGTSAWLLVLFSIKRILLIKSLNVNRKASFIAATMVVLTSMAFSSHYLFGFKISKVNLRSGNFSYVNSQCSYASEHFETFYKTKWPFMVLIGLNLLPVVLILIANGTVVTTLFNRRKALRKIHPANRTSRLTLYKKETSMTKIMFVISAFFVCTSLPFTINGVLKSRRRASDLEEQVHFALLDTTVHFILYCNFAFRFLSYFVSSTLFRQELIKFFSTIMTKCMFFTKLG